LDQEEIQDILEIIRICIPRLKKMAAKSDNPYDDIVVNIISILIGAGKS